MTAIQCEEVTHVYSRPGESVTALRNVSFTVHPGETVSVSGPSGCGKSTLLSLITGLQRPTGGRIIVSGENVSTMSERQLLALRAHRIGVVVQNPGRVLLPHSSAEDNIGFARAAVDRARRDALPDGAALLAQLGLRDLSGRAAGTLSGGEQQRLAVAVAVANQPDLLVADEPTSQLDDCNRDAVVAVLKAANRQWGTTVFVVSHDDAVGRSFGRTIRLEGGAIDSDEPSMRGD